MCVDACPTAAISSNQ
ncbi:MAG: hypothetical protein K8R08_12650 [Methanosarcinales archaeon]|nr:hypothetical protein [Methanosarcinales archaeon]